MLTSLKSKYVYNSKKKLVWPIGGDARDAPPDHGQQENRAMPRVIWGSSGGIVLRMRRNAHFSTYGLKYDTTKVFGDPNVQG